MNENKLTDSEVRHVDAGIEFPRSSLMSGDRKFDVKPEEKD